MTRFLLDEVARRPHERGLLFVAPGAGMAGALRDGLEALRGALAAHRDRARRRAQGRAGRRGSRSPGCRRSAPGTQAPFLIYFGEGSPYALLREPGERGRHA